MVTARRIYVCGKIITGKKAFMNKKNLLIGNPNQ